MSSLSVKFGEIIPLYNGEGDFAEWLQKLELVADIQGVKKLEDFLPLFLTGGAFAVFLSLSAVDRKNYKAIVQALTQAFVTNPFAAYESLIARRLHPGESVDVYLAEITKLARIMCPSGAAEELIKCAFVSGLPSVSKTQLQASCALRTMSLAEVVEKARVLNVPGEASFVARASHGEPQLRCYNCNGVGHMSRNCSSPPKVKSFPTSKGGEAATARRCFRCDEVGHLARDCEKSKNGQGRLSSAPAASLGNGRSCQ